MTGEWLEGAFLVVTVPAWLGIWWLRTHQLGRCWRCGGSGKNPLSTKRRKGPCRHCGGTGWVTRRI